MSDSRNHAISARAGFFKVSVTCSLQDDGLSILRGTAVSRIGYDAIRAIRFHRHAPKRAVLVLTPSSGRDVSFLLQQGRKCDREITDFVTALVARVARAAPQTCLVIGPSRRQWVASWVGVLVSGLVLSIAAWSGLAGRPLGSLAMPIAVALVNLGVVLPILRSGKPRHHRVSDAPIAPG